MTSGIILLGASGHAKVIIELLQASGYAVDFCIDNNTHITSCLNVPVLQGDHHLSLLKQQGYTHAFVAIGNNALRLQLIQHLLALDFQLVNAISSHAFISPSAKLGIGLAIMAGVVINADTHIDDGAIINTGAVVDHDCYIGKGAHIAPQCGLAGKVTVGDRAFLGVGCKVIPNISIAKDTVIGAGSVVISAIASGKKAVGVPARIIN